MNRYPLCPTLFATLNLIFGERQNIAPCWNVRPDIKYKNAVLESYTIWEAVGISKVFEVQPHIFQRFQ